MRKMNLDDVKKLMEMDPSELIEMDKSIIHEGYKIIVACMLIQFCSDISDMTDEIQGNEDLKNFIYNWVEKNIKSPHSDWNVGDCAS